jgi:hypothetical protein
MLHVVAVQYQSLYFLLYKKGLLDFSKATNNDDEGKKAQIKKK